MMEDKYTVVAIISDYRNTYLSNQWMENELIS